MALPVRSDTLSDFATSVIHATSAKDPLDVITPDHPVFNRLRKKAGGSFPTAPPGFGPVTENLIYDTPDRMTEASLSQDVQSLDYTPAEVSTLAEYQWSTVYQTLTIGWEFFKHTKGKYAVTKHVEKQMKAHKTEVKNKQVYWLWNGNTVGTHKFFGIKDFVQVDPTSNPARGSVGGIDASTTPGSTFWRNKYQNFNGAAFTIVSNELQSNLFNDLDGTKGIALLYRQMTYIDKGGETPPDMMPANWLFINALERAIQSRVIVADKQDSYGLGISSPYMYKNMATFYDSSVGDDASSPGVASTGAAYLLNSDFFTYTLCSAPEDSPTSWGDKHQVPGKTAWAWIMGLTHTLSIRDRRRFGLIYNVTAGTSS